MINRCEFDFECAYMRMTEFYDISDIDWFLDNVYTNNIYLDSAMQWLDTQTINRYITGVDIEPDIERNLLELLVDGFFEQEE